MASVEELEITDTVQAKGPKFQVTISKEVRKALKIRDGDFLEIKVKKVTA